MDNFVDWHSASRFVNSLPSDRALSRILRLNIKLIPAYKYKEIEPDASRVFTSIPKLCEDKISWGTENNGQVLEELGNLPSTRFYEGFYAIRLLKYFAVARLEYNQPRKDLESILKSEIPSAITYFIALIADRMLLNSPVNAKHLKCTPPKKSRSTRDGTPGLETTKAVLLYMKENNCDEKDALNMFHLTEKTFDKYREKAEIDMKSIADLIQEAIDLNQK